MLAAGRALQAAANHVLWKNHLSDKVPGISKQRASTYRVGASRGRETPLYRICDTTKNSTAMDDLEDELDLRFHRGLNPDVYYRCPTLEVRAHHRAVWMQLKCI
jgi:hypothetical protein